MRVRLAAIVLLPLLVAAGCADRAPEAWIASATAAFRASEAAHARGDLPAAREALTDFLAESRPEGLHAADRRAVVQDAWFCLAQIALDGDDPAAALAYADRGLAEGGEGDLFVANLLVARGHALERLGRDREAVDTYARALDLNERLLEAALQGARP